MKNLITLCIIFFLNVNAFSQSFDNVKVQGSLDNVISQYRAKNYTLLKRGEEYAQMSGIVLNKKVELYIFATPKTKVVWKVSVFMPEQVGFYSIKREYDDMLENFKEKYGAPDNSYAFFTSPYYEGDGYEVQAIRLEKANFISFWENKDNTNIILEISKYMQLKISYENVNNVSIMQQEKKNQNKSVF